MNDLPGYFPPLFLLMTQMMIRMRSKIAMATIIPMNQPAVAISCLCSPVKKSTNEKSVLSQVIITDQWGWRKQDRCGRG